MLEEQNFEILTEAQVLNEVRIRRSKLQSQEEHLRSLLRKKARLDSEILQLRRAIKENTSNFKKQVQEGKKYYSESTDEVLNSDQFSQFCLEKTSTELQIEYKQLMITLKRTRDDLEFLKELCEKMLPIISKKH